MQTTPRAPQPPINLMQLVLSLNVGGLERVVINLLQGLDRDRYRLVLCCLDAEGSLIEEVRRRGVRVVTLGKKPQGLDPGLVLRLAARLRRESVDILHCHNPSPHLYGVGAAWLARRPAVVYTHHGHESFRWDRWLARATRQIIAVSDDARRVLIEREHIPAAKITTVHNGIDLDRARPGTDVPAKKRSLGLSAGDRVIGTVGRLAPEKDQATLLEAFRLVRDRAGLPVKLVLVGDGALRPALEEQAARLGIREHTLFLGERTDVAELLELFDVFALSSVSEGISLTLLEAMAAARPVVATDVGGNAEVVVAGETGLIVPARDPERFAEAMAQVLRDGARARRMGEQGRERVAREFSRETMIRQHDRIYGQIMSERRARR